jgi:hypothetical protein
MATVLAAMPDAELRSAPGDLPAATPGEPGARFHIVMTPHGLAAVREVPVPHPIGPVGTPLPPPADQALSRSLAEALGRNDLEAVREAFAAPHGAPQRATQALLAACIGSDLAPQALRMGSVAFWNTAPWEMVGLPPRVLARLREAGVDAVLLARCNARATHRLAPVPTSPHRPLASRLAWFRDNLPEARGHVAFEVRHDTTFATPVALLEDPRLWRADWSVKYADGERGSDAGGITDTWLSEKLCAAATPGSGVLAGRGIDGAKLFFDPALAGPLDDAKRQTAERLGHLAGKAVWRGLTVPELRLCQPLLSRLAGRAVAPSLALLGTLNAPLAEAVRNTMRLSEAALQGSEVPFSIPDPAAPGAELPLDPADPDKLVTVENRGDYGRLASQVLLERFDPAMEAFARGFYSHVPQALLRPFSDAELERLIAGETEVDLLNLREHTDLALPLWETPREGVVGAEQVMVWFFEILTQWQKGDVPSLRQVASPPEEGLREGGALISKLLWQVTGASAPPIGGFANLEQRFTIYASTDPHDTPNVHTCFHRLDLPGLPQVGGKEALETILLALAERTAKFTDD